MNFAIMLFRHFDDELLYLMKQPLLFQGILVVDSST